MGQLQRYLRTVQLLTKRQWTMESVETNLGLVSQYLVEVKEEKSKQKILMNLQLAVAELENIKTILMENVRGQVTDRQLEVIGGRGTEDLVDPSFQYFGAEWSAVFSKLFNTGLSIRIYKQRKSAGYLDLLSLASIMSEIDKVKEVELHMMFVKPGNKNLPSSVASKRENVKYRKARTENLNDKCYAAVQQEKAKVTSTTARNKRKSVIETFTNIFNFRI